MRSLDCDRFDLLRIHGRMTKIKHGFWYMVINIIILPAVCDGGQAGRTVEGARRRNRRFDPEVTAVTSVRQSPRRRGGGTATKLGVRIPVPKMLQHTCIHFHSFYFPLS